MENDLLKEYAKASEALSNWFISQEIDPPRACGIMCFLVGICIGESATSKDDLATGVDRHISVIDYSARLTNKNKRQR